MMKGVYINVYNAVSSILWLVVAFQAIWRYQVAFKLATIAQTINLIDIIHALTNTTKSTATPAIMQAASRLLSLSLISSTGLLWERAVLGAWGVADAVRFAYYLYPKAVQWPRYNLFIVLYPIGFLCELIVIYVSGVGDLVKWGLLAVWPVGFYLMYSHMFHQRGKLHGTRGTRVTKIKSK